MTRFLQLTTLLLFSACNAEWGGTSVGNPGKMTGVVGPTPDVTLDYADTWVDRVEFTDCDGIISSKNVNAVVDLIYGFNVVAPGGENCGAQLIGDGYLYVTGQTTGTGDLFTAYLQTDGQLEVATNYGFFVDGQDFVLELGGPGWMDEATLDLQFSGEEIFETDPRAMTLADRIIEDIALFEDPDGDGQVSDTERDDGAVASAAVARGEEDDSDRPHVSGEEAKCTSAPMRTTVPPWALCLSLIWLRRRPRR
jgi:hypothetical protein